MPPGLSSVMKGDTSMSNSRTEELNIVQSNRGYSVGRVWVVFDAIALTVSQSKIIRGS